MSTLRDALGKSWSSRRRVEAEHAQTNCVRLSMNLRVGRVTPCAPFGFRQPFGGAHGVTRPTRGRRFEIILQVLGLVTSLPFLFAFAASAQSIQQIFTNGPAATRINIVFLSEGYTAAQLGQFPTDARSVLSQLLNTPPFSLYSNYFNAFAISVASTQAGSDHYTPTTNLVNTYFNSTYDSYGIQRLITIPPNDRDSNAAHGEGKVTTLLQTLMPQYDIVALIVNDSVYGGSGGTFLLTSINSSAPEIAVHELGHSFAKLGDEYSSPFPGYPDTEEPNTTTQTNRSLIKWRAWILDSTPIPTPEISLYLDAVGLFEGAHYHATGWYRPKFNCKMNHLGVPFCEVCAETLVKSMYGQIRPIESFSPGTNTLITLTNSSTTNLSVVSLMPSGGSVGIQWFTNNIPVPGATSPVDTSM